VKRICDHLFRLFFAVALLASCSAASGATTKSAQIRGGDFTLSAPGGHLSLSDFRGKVVLIFFGYTSCPDVCPLSLAKIDASFAALREEELDRVRAFFITLDPEHDTADRLERYTGYFHTHIIGLRGEAAAIDAVTDAYGVSYSRSPMPDSALGYSISHPTDVFLIDGEGRVVETIPHDARSDYFLARIRRLLDAPE
jgi:protein SCO1/2